MGDKQVHQPITGFDLFHDAMVVVLSENGLQSEATMEKLLDVFLSLEDGLRKRIDTMASNGYSILPRSLVEYVKQFFTFNPPNLPVQQNKANPQDGGAASSNTSHLSSSLQDSSVTGQRHSLDTFQQQSVQSTVQQPSNADLFAAATSPIICKSGCIGATVFGQENFAALKHPTIAHVYVKIPIEFVGQTDIQPTAVPLLYDQMSGQEIHINGQKLPTISLVQGSTTAQGPRLALLVTSLGNTASLVSEIIKVAQGVIFLYDILSKTWFRLWG